MKEIPIKLLREYFYYNKDNGTFTWLKSGNSNGSKEGSIAGHKMKNGRFIITLKGNKILASRVAFAMHYNRWPFSGMEIDHINGNKSDDRIVNLRECTRQQNVINRGVQKNNKLGLKGIRFVNKKYVASITVNKKQIYLGTFKNLDEAKNIYNLKCKELFGDFARIN
jgi:hypothetical protein